MSLRVRRALEAGLLAILAACAPVGPEFVKPEVELPSEWSDQAKSALEFSPVEQPQWWRVFDDPVLDGLIEMAWQKNNTLEIAGLRVLEARAQLGIAQGNQYPQSQLAAGDATYVSPADNLGGSSNFWQYGIGASASWEIDFWGRFRRGIESADAAYMASIAARDQALILLTAQVVNTYTLIRINEEQLRYAQESLEIQQRSYDITGVLYRNGYDSELDMQQAHTLLLSTQATIPGFETALVQARNALNTLLGEPPGTIDDVLGDGLGIPKLPEVIEVGIPADLLRRRPDLRQAELNALALQKPIEDVLGAVSIYAQQPIVTGDLCKYGTSLGQVEEIGLRTTRIRTLNNTLVSVPNAIIAHGPIENYSAREKILYHPDLPLRYDTTVEQMQNIIDGIESMAREHEKVITSSVRCRFTAYAENALIIRLRVYVDDTDFSNYLSVVSELNMSIMRIVEDAGAHFAQGAKTIMLENGTAPLPG